ncbi:MAG: family 2 glycosyl transferase [Roseibaca calidilacus]|uniref:Family 2 glycosyl transferase n=1 Tax=Roseibaca calidilacus TaxID=1666912 RepID=A0A0P8AIN2_9RHOB|nr:glycosyltransferase family 2 protein [Roseibaca calidilacus]KPP94247.1 MAG: family 2 glycosyl transferase [Roseibaca calidilacus]CUX81308.1 Glycosyltransferase, GT2 family [Roseibaca calidilacus]
MSACVDICIPFFKDDPVLLIEQIARQTDADRYRLLVCDDGSGLPDLSQRVAQALQAHPGPAVFFTLAANCGRAHARNVMLQDIRSDWVLMLDADMALDRPDFIEVYRSAARRMGHACCVVGGFRIDPSDVTPATRLHAAQSAKSECKPASQRARDPGRFVYSSSVFVHRSIIERHIFDPQFQAWGWEDVEWGWRIVQDSPVYHIDNPARHLGLDPDRVLVAKYAESVDNFRRIRRLYPEKTRHMPIARASYMLSFLPFQTRLGRVLKWVALLGALPAGLRVYALKLYRASLYARVYHD